MKKVLLSVVVILTLVACAIAHADTPIDTITEWVSGGIGEGESITSITLEDNRLAITVDLSGVDEMYPGYLVDLATERASSITDIILEHEDFDAEWDTIHIEYPKIGYFDLTKDDIETNEYDMRYMNVYDADYNSRIVTVG